MRVRSYRDVAIQMAAAQTDEDRAAALEALEAYYADTPKLEPVRTRMRILREELQRALDMERGDS